MFNGKFLLIVGPPNMAVLLLLSQGRRVVTEGFDWHLSRGCYDLTVEKSKALFLHGL